MKILSGAVAALILFTSGVSLAFAQSTANLTIGDKIVIVDTINVRSSADGPVIGTQTRGMTGTLVGGPQNAGGYVWWKVDYNNGTDGWSAEDFMQQSSVALTVPASSVVAVAAVAGSQPSQSSILQTLASLKSQLQSLLAELDILNQAQTAAAGASQ